MSRILVFAYGLIAYALFGVTYLYAVGFVGNLVVPKSLDSTPTAPFATALLINLGRAWTTLRRERPDVIVSSGAAAAVPFFWLGRVCFGTRNVFIECVDRMDNPTLTARLVRPVTDQFLAQWDSQLDGFPRRRRVEVSR